MSPGGSASHQTESEAESKWLFAKSHFQRSTCSELQVERTSIRLLHCFLLSFHLIWMKRNKGRAAHWFSLCSLWCVQNGFFVTQRACLRRKGEMTGLKLFDISRSVPSGGDGFVQEETTWTEPRGGALAPLSECQQHHFQKILTVIAKWIFCTTSKGV